MPKNSARLSALALTTAVLVASTAACQGGDSTEAAAADAVPAALTGQRLDWRSCPAPSTAQGGGPAPGDAWQCATLKAPRDYAAPDEGTLDIALIRKKATDEKRRIGSLVYNFGGPGGSGVTTLPGLAKDYAKLNSRYDLVSFDPRGVGASSGVRCLDAEGVDAMSAADATPDDAAEVRKMRAESKAYTAACEKNSGKVLPHVDTVSAARDMDLMREVLGDDKLHYFGISYGTELGGVYAHLFPKKVGRAVLDAVVDPTEDPVEGALAQTKGFQLALENFMKDCTRTAKAQGLPACPTGKGGAEGSARIAALLKKLDAEPLPTKSGRALTESQALTGVVAALYSKEQWPLLQVALTEAMGMGAGDTLLALNDSYLGRDDKGRYSTMNDSNRAINCVDDRQRYTEKDARAHLPEFREASPVFGAYLAWGLTGCSDWPVEGETDGPEVSAKGAAPILVAGTTGDPATPYEGARKMAAALGEGVGVNVTLKGEGHGGYNSGNPCLQRTVDAYLLDSEVPADGTTCA
ncbi:alpha/beta hydrolase [Streptomyces cavernicola]|uniref:Alpha/beta hydrolase n=1 Tax=Streptomyces cavernicola TaxID=3043613 RepID=A0ABT6SFL9_9ACTN|nr:alpha/beta hydrolase [Streptomyces sp. B-S-A6]MDI3406986.1 alpha/beta hydrolase [Streptomyces sp. B-S-A6]